MAHADRVAVSASGEEAQAYRGLKGSRIELGPARGHGDLCPADCPVHAHEQA
jgi:hypothetical protein